MAYDEDLAHCIREQLAEQENETETTMSGGPAWLLHSNMSVGISEG